jgi:hypothetical protein
LWILVAPWVAVAIVRWLTLPAALVPRRELADERAGASALALRWISAVVVAIVAWKNREILFPRPTDDGARVLLPGVLAITEVSALLIVIDYGLERARRAPFERALVIAVCACALAGGILVGADRPTARVGLCFGAGAAFAIPWLRRADRRALALAVSSFAGAALDSTLGAALGFVGLAWLCACSARPARKLVGLSGAGAFAVCAALRAAAEAHAPTKAIEGGAPDGLGANAWLFAVLASLFASTWMVAAWARWRERSRARATVGIGERDASVSDAVPFERDAEFLSELGFTTLIVIVVYGQWSHAFATIEIAPLFAPILLLSIGRVLVRADHNAEHS